MIGRGGWTLASAQGLEAGVDRGMFFSMDLAAALALVKYKLTEPVIAAGDPGGTMSTDFVPHGLGDVQSLVKVKGNTRG
ncbi:hypothetical protein [Shewanella sp.]|uniref:hypothetical protein n=1 Tax=Shewanella sp. TaxID=50422 RepID=UPI0035631C0D